MSNRSSYFFYTFRMHRLQNYNCNFPPFLLYCNCNFSTSFIAVLSVKKVNFRHMSRTRFPSRDATASQHWSTYTDRVEIASLDLMQVWTQTQYFFLVNCIFELTRRPSRAFNLASSCVASGKSEIRARYLVALVQGLRSKQVIQTLIVCL